MTGLADHLTDKGLLSPSALIRAEEVRTRTSARLPSTLVRLGLIADDELAKAFSELYRLPLASRQVLASDKVAIQGLNPRFLARHAVLPISNDNGQLVVAMADPEDEEACSGLAFASGCTVVPIIASFSDIENALGSETVDDIALGGIGHDQGGASGDIDRMLEGDSEAPVIRLVNRLLTNAVNRRASDVHIEPMAHHVVVRYRIDGRLIEVERLSDALAAPIVSRIKVMAHLDIAESRLPQDGRLRLAVRGRDVDVRVATTPIAFGESVVMRLLGRSEVALDLEKLGLPAASLKALIGALERPHGIILLTGPTGSGKTTTLYAALSHLRRPEVKILTVEDPVEVLLDGVNQVQVRPEIDLSYAATLRAFLRQDPDILMIGEIRDFETAEIAMRAALTGHLVLSTLHTNSALGAFTRLADIGVQPYLTASTVIATVAQRLIRQLCADCRRARPVGVIEREQFVAAAIVPPSEIFEPIGCEHCQGSGYRGRIPLIEIVEVDDALRQLVRDGRAEEAEAARPISETLLGHGLAHVADGRTTLAEVQRAVQLG